MTNRIISRKQPVRIQNVPWRGFYEYFSRAFRQGDHVSLIGSTGCGKTTLAFYGLLPIREYVAVLATKPKDRQLSSLIGNEGYVKIRKWPPELWDHRVLLWPNATHVTDTINQAVVFSNCLTTIYETGAWCVYIDELHYMIDTLKMERLLSMLWQQGRSIDISLVASMQRPAKVPLLAYTQATHLFFWRCNDEADLKRIGGIGWQDSRVVREVVANLYGPPGSAPPNKCCQFLYVNARSGELIVSRLDRR
jgi:hypothetical protein